MTTLRRALYYVCVTVVSAVTIVLATPLLVLLGRSALSRPCEELVVHEDILDPVLLEDDPGVDVDGTPPVSE